MNHEFVDDLLLAFAFQDHLVDHLPHLLADLLFADIQPNALTNGAPELLLDFLGQRLLFGGELARVVGIHAAILGKDDDGEQKERDESEEDCFFHRGDNQMRGVMEGHP